MAMPRKLVAFDVFIDGESYLGRAEEITLPKLALKTENYQGAGMMGSVSVLMGFDDSALEMDITMGGLSVELIKRHGSGIDEVQLRYMGSYYDDATRQAVSCEIQTRGRLPSMDWGTSKQGANTQHKFTMKNTYYKLTVDNEVLVEVDFLNLKWVVGGQDLWAEHRKNMGH